MEICHEHPRERAQDFADVVGEAVVSARRFAPVDQFFFAEDLDAGGGSDEADGDADEKSHLRDGAVVYGGGEDGVGLEVEAAEVYAFGFELREADEEAAEGGETDFEEEGGAEAVLLQEGAEGAVVDLLVERSAAGFDGATEGEGFFGLFIGGEGRGLGEGWGVVGAEAAFRAGFLGFLHPFPVVDEGPDAAVSGGFVEMTLAGDDVHDCVGWVYGMGKSEAKVFEVGLNVLFGALVNDTTSAEEDERVQGFEDLGSGLMDDCYNGDVET